MKEQGVEGEVCVAAAETGPLLGFLHLTALQSCPQLGHASRPARTHRDESLDVGHIISSQ